MSGRILVVCAHESIDEAVTHLGHVKAAIARFFNVRYVYFLSVSINLDVLWCALSACNLLYSADDPRGLVLSNVLAEVFYHEKDQGLDAASPQNHEFWSPSTRTFVDILFPEFNEQKVVSADLLVLIVGVSFYRYLHVIRHEKLKA